jgi:hypothetical protein
VHKNRDSAFLIFLRYCPLLIFILNFCPGHFSESIKAMDLKLYRMTDLIRKKCIRTGTLHFLFLSYYPLLIFILYFCPGHFSYIIKAMDLKLHRMIDLIDKKCSVKKLLLCTSYLLNYCPLLIFLSWPFLLNYIVNKATHPTHVVLVYFIFLLSYQHIKI